MTSSPNAEKYLSSHHILIYLEDAICQLLEQKEDNSKVNPAKFFADYFNSIERGTHTLFREYRFVAATPYNRACFTHTFWKCFRYIGKKQDLLQVREYHALLSLLSFDFPYEIVQKTARIILMDDALDCLMSFPDFIYAFQVQFYFNEFLCKCADIFNKLLSSPHSPREAVVVPTETTEGKNNSPLHGGKNGCLTERTTNASDTVDAQLFLKSLVSHCEKAESFAPLPNILREILLPLQRVSFYGFVMGLVKCETLNSSIGKLPPKVKLLDYNDVDKEKGVHHHENNNNSGSNLPRTNSKGATPIARYAIHGTQFGNLSGTNGITAKPNILTNGPIKTGTISPLPSAGNPSSRLHTPVSMSLSRSATATSTSKKGTAVGGSHEALESGVGTESAVDDTTDSGPDDPSTDDEETSDEN